MKSFFKYYVVDSVTETIIGSFDAINLDMAKMMMKKSILENPKIQDFSDQLLLFCDKKSVSVCETYKEVVEKMVIVPSNSWRVSNVGRENDNGSLAAADD